MENHSASNRRLIVELTASSNLVDPKCALACLAQLSAKTSLSTTFGDPETCLSPCAIRFVAADFKLPSSVSCMNSGEVSPQEMLTQRLPAEARKIEAAYAKPTVPLRPAAETSIGGLVETRRWYESLLSFEAQQALHDSECTLRWCS